MTILHLDRGILPGLPIKLGFTGTSRGMTMPQFERFCAVFDWLLQRHGVTEAHHGDCVGADAQFDMLCWRRLTWRYIHPPVDEKARAFCHIQRDNSFILLPQREYLERNHDIVRATDILIAAPKEEDGESLRSGTWATVRFARSVLRPIAVIRPSGRVEWRING